jgi:hypothetical protein
MKGNGKKEFQISVGGTPYKLISSWGPQSRAHPSQTAVKTACKVRKVSALNETSYMIPVRKVSAINEATPPIEKHKESIASGASGNSLDALKAYESPGKQKESLVPGYESE